MNTNKSLSEFVIIDRYARYNATANRRETKGEMFDRVMQMFIRRYPVVEDEIRWAFKRVVDGLCLPSMRALQFAGDAIESNHCRMYNCSFSICDRLEFFDEAFFLLLCGTGVGFSVELDHVDKLPALAEYSGHDEHHVVADNIEGWGLALRTIIMAYFDGHHVDVSYKNIRAEGTPLKTSGGTAPGPVQLRKSIRSITEILGYAHGRKLSSIECYDIIMYAAQAVVAGGIRRSACICLFSKNDDAMIHAKDPDQIKDNPQRYMSNNSVKLMRDTCTHDDFKNIIAAQREAGTGEPGFYFAENAQYGSNPCVEIGLNPILDGKTGWQFCNLTEMNGSKITSLEIYRDAVEASAIIGTCQAGFTDFHYLDPIVKQICDREALLGMSITGMQDNPAILLDPSNQRKMARYAITINEKIAKKIGINAAARVTCVKPAGTTSCVFGTGSGIHPHIAKEYFRRIRCNKLSPLFKHFVETNPHMIEDDKYAPNTAIIKFCVRSPDNSLHKDDIGPLKMLENVCSTQRNWVIPGTAYDTHSPGLHHNVSNTIFIRDNEWDEVSNYIWANRSILTGIAMFQLDENQYEQLPMEPVTTAEQRHDWKIICEKHVDVDWTTLNERCDQTTPEASSACEGGLCSIKSPGI